MGRTRTVFALALLLPAIVSGCLYGTEDAERRVAQVRGVGETNFYAFSRPPSGPFEWVSDHEVLWLTIGGRATVNVITGEISEVADPSVTPNTLSETRAAPLNSRTLPPGSRYGPWEVRQNGHLLATDDSLDVSCGGLLVSPDRKYVACGYSVVNRLSEETKHGTAVIRLR